MSSANLASIAHLIAVIGLALALAAPPAAAQPLTCVQCSDLFEEAATRQSLIDARRAIGRSLASLEIDQRLEAEIAALEAMGGGLTPADVDQCYRRCRFDLDRSDAELRAGPPTVASTNCMACTAVVEVVNDACDTLQAVAAGGGNQFLLGEVLAVRDRAVDALMACEQQACRTPWLERNATPVSAADYQHALRATADPRVWVAQPIDITALPDYTVSMQHFGADLREGDE